MFFYVTYFCCWYFVSSCNQQTFAFKVYSDVRDVLWVALHHEHRDYCYCVYRFSGAFPPLLYNVQPTVTVKTTLRTLPLPNQTATVTTVLPKHTLTYAVLF